MVARVLPFFRRSVLPRDWSAQELAEFYRVEAALLQSGLRVDADRGLTDEGEPWFIFCRVEDDEVIIHFARIDGQYVISAPAYCGNAVGYDFRALVRSMIERHPVLRPKADDSNLFLHPTAFLVVLVASALLKTGHAASAAPPVAGQGIATTNEKLRGAVSSTITNVALEAPHEALILAAISAAIGAPVQAATITVTATQPAATHASDSTDQPLPPSTTNALPLDLPHEPHSVGGSSMIPIASAYPQAPTMPPLGMALTHAAPTSDTPLAVINLITPAHPLPLFDMPSLLAAPSPMGIDPILDAQHVSLSMLSTIPQADKGLLQTVGVAGLVTYLNAPPSVFSAAINAGVHIDARSLEPTHAPVSSDMAAAVSAPAASSPNTTSAPSAGSVPELSAVIAIVELFQAVEIRPVVLITDHYAIFYDAQAMATDPSGVTSVTYDFHDGFSISLVGLPSELAHAGIHV